MIRPCVRLLAGIAIASLPGVARAQTVAGTVVDRNTSAPLAGVTIIVRSARDSTTIRGAVSDSLGQFSVLLPRSDTVYVIARRIGLEPLTTPAKEILAERTRTLRFEMEAVPQQLDTVRTQAKKSISGAFYKLTAGQEWFAQHLRAGKGFFTSGTEIEMSGLLPCDYLGRLPGLEIAPVLVRDASAIGCYEGDGQPVRHVVTKNQATCLEAYVDRRNPLMGVDPKGFGVAIPGFAKVKWLPLEGIRGIEIFANYEDRPKDFSYVPKLPPPPVRGSGNRVNRAATTLRAGAQQQRCVLILIWTAQYWGD